MRTAKQPAPVVQEWDTRLALLNKSTRMGIPVYEIARLAGLMALIGSIQNKEAVDLYNAVRMLMFAPHRRKKKTRWASIVASIPADRESLLRLQRNVQAYCSLIDPHLLGSGNFKVDEVVVCMLQVTDPIAYAKHGLQIGITHPGALYHPRTIEAAKRIIRGAFKSDTYIYGNHSEQIRKRVKVVRD